MACIKHSDRFIRCCINIPSPRGTFESHMLVRVPRRVYANLFCRCTRCMTFYINDPIEHKQHNQSLLYHLQQHSTESAYMVRWMLQLQALRFTRLCISALHPYYDTLQQPQITFYDQAIAIIKQYINYPSRSDE